MKKRRQVLLLGLLAITAILVASCGAKGTNTAQGEAIFETRSNVAGLEGLFQRGDSAATIEEKANDNGLRFRKLEVANFIAWTRNEITVVGEPNQPFIAYAFLPTEATTADGLMIVVKRDNDVTQAVLGFNCTGIKFYLDKASVTDFTNEFCS